MAAKKKTQRKQTKKRQSKKRQTKSKPTPKKFTAAKKSTPSAKKKKATKKQPIRSKGAVKKRAVKPREFKSKTVANRPLVAKKAAAAKRRSSGGNPTMDVVESPLNSARARTGGQSGDLQGLSNVEGAAAESVDELLEEGNSFEAGVVAGVERAGNADEEEVRTREVPEDDVPTEYLDRDR
jgi:hypothetical protein